MGKSKKIKGRKRKKSTRSQTTTPRATRRALWFLIFGVIVCAILVGISVSWFFSTTSDRTKETRQTSVSFESKTTKTELTYEEQIAAFKEEEMQLAGHTMKEFPDSGGSYMLIGDLHARHGDSAEAMKFWKKNLEINPKNFIAWRNMGRIALEKEQFDQAVKFLRKALEINPETTGLRSDIAKAFMDSGKYAKAVTELQEEIKIFPSSFTARFQLAEAYRQQKEYDKAIEHYEQTIRLEPEHSHAHYGLAMVYTRMGQPDKAREHLAAFRKLRVKVDSAYSDRQIGSVEYLASLRASVVKTYLDAELLYRNSGNTAKSEQLLNRASEVDPNNTRCLERLASLYYTSDRVAKALGCFEKMARVDPNNTIFYLNIGQIATKLRMFEKAEQAFRKTIALAPNDPAGYRELARFHLRTNTNLALAYSLAQKAITLGKNAETYFLLGWAADVNGNRAGALQAMEQAIKLEPNNQKYRKIYERIRARN